MRACQNEFEDKKSIGRHKHFQTLQLANEFPKFLNLQKSTLCRVSKFWHADSTVSTSKRNSQFLNEMNTHFRNLKPYTACNLLETQAPALKSPTLSHCAQDFQLRHDAPISWVKISTQKFLDSKRKWTHLRNKQWPDCGKIERKTESLNPPCFLVSKHGKPAVSYYSLQFLSASKFVHSKSCSESERAWKQVQTSFCHLRRLQSYNLQYNHHSVQRKYFPD